jgi:hypothetical protein
MNPLYITVRTYLCLKFRKTFGEYRNIVGTYTLGWWSGVRRLEDWLATLAEMGLQVLKGTLISPFHLVSVGGSTEKRSVMI